MNLSPAQAADTAPNAFTRGKIYRVEGWQWLLFWPAALGLDLYYKTLRVSMPPEERALLEATPGPRLLVLWHNRSLLLPVMFRHFDYTRIRCLISASKLAAWEAAYFDHWGMRSIRGSSTRRGIQATREMLKAIRAGHDLAISPDGPSGPLYAFKRGAIMVARQCNVPMILITANARQAHRLKTWDRHLVPLPFSRVELRARVIPPLRDLNFENDAAIAEYLRKEALDISDR